MDRRQLFHSISSAFADYAESWQRSSIRMAVGKEQRKAFD
jgi:hypothetical protein